MWMFSVTVECQIDLWYGLFIQQVFTGKIILCQASFYIRGIHQWISFAEELTAFVGLRCRWTQKIHIINKSYSILEGDKHYRKNKKYNRFRRIGRTICGGRLQFNSIENSFEPELKKPRESATQMPWSEQSTHNVCGSATGAEGVTE